MNFVDLLAAERADGLFGNRLAILPKYSNRSRVSGRRLVAAVSNVRQVDLAEWLGGFDDMFAQVVVPAFV